MNKTNISFIFATCLLILSCNKNEVTCNGQTPNYTSNIKKLFDDNCIQCHGAGSNNGDYSNYAKLIPIISNGKLEDVLLKKQSMPKGKRLSSEELSMLKCWFENSTPE